MEHGSHLGGSQQPGFSQTLLTALESVAAQGMLDANGIKGAASARAQTALVEDVRDFIGGVAVQHPIDFLDDRWAQFAELVYAARQREGKNVGSAALEPDADGDVLPLGQSDVLEKQAGHALALAVGCVWILPEP